MRTWRSRVVLLVAVALAASGCFGGAGSDTKDNPVEVALGLLTPLSGPNKGGGEDAQRGAQLAADIVNGIVGSVPLPLAEESGLPNLGNAHIKIVVRDSKSDPQRAAEETSRLVTENGVVSLIGAYDPETTLTASLRAERIPVPFVNGDTSLSFLTERGLDWFFRLGPSVRDSGEAFFSLLRRQESKSLQETNQVASTRRLAIMYTADKRGIDIESVIEELALEGGYQVVSKVALSPTATDLTSQVAQVQAANPDVLFLAPSAETVPVMVKSFGARRYKPKGVLAYPLGFLSLEMLKRANPVVSGLCREVAWSSELAARNPAARAVTDLYQKKFNMQMTEVAAEAFTAVLTVAMAINNAGSTDAAKIRSALLALDIPGQQTIMPWRGIRFDETHQNQGATSVVEQFVNKSFRVVYPRDAAYKSSMIWPASAAP